MGAHADLSLGTWKKWKDMELICWYPRKTNDPSFLSMERKAVEAQTGSKLILPHVFQAEEEQTQLTAKL